MYSVKTSAWKEIVPMILFTFQEFIYEGTHQNFVHFLEEYEQLFYSFFLNIGILIFVFSFFKVNYTLYSINII